MEAIDMLLNDLESEILKAKKAAFSNTDIVVNRKTMLDLVARVRANLPQVIQDAMRINRDENDIISRANAYAQSAIQAADEKAQSAVNDSEITKQAEQRAREIVDDAQRNYNHIIYEARSHGFELLKAAESYISGLLDVIHESMNNLNQ